MSDSVQPHRRPPTRLLCPWDSPGKNTGVGCHFLLQCMKVKSESEVAQSCPTLHDPMDCSLPGFSIHGIFQARVLEWVAIAFSGVFYKLTQNSCSSGNTREAQNAVRGSSKEATEHKELQKKKSKELYGVLTGEGNGNPLQCSCLENPRDRGAW